MSSYTQYGFGDSSTWGAFAGHPNDPRFDADEAEEEIRDQARKIKGLISVEKEVPTDMQLAVADRLIRYLDESDVVDLINGIFAKDKNRVFESVEALIDGAVNALAEHEHED